MMDKPDIDTKCVIDPTGDYHIWGAWEAHGDNNMRRSCIVCGYIQQDIIVSSYDVGV